MKLYLVKKKNINEILNKQNKKKFPFEKVSLTKNKAKNKIKKHVFFKTIKILIYQNCLSEALLCSYFENKNEFKAEKFLYNKL